MGSSSVNILSGRSLYDSFIIPLNQVYGDGTQPTIAEYSKEDFLKIIPEFKELFSSEDSNKYDIMFDIYSNIGLNIFSNPFYGKQSILCLTLWIAHNIAISLPRTKNIENEFNLDSQNISLTAQNDMGGKDKKQLLAGFKEKYSLTSYGRILYPIMQQAGLWSIRGVR